MESILHCSTGGWGSDQGIVEWLLSLCRGLQWLYGRLSPQCSSNGGRRGLASAEVG